MGYAAYFEYCFGVYVSFGYGFFYAVFAYEVYDGGVFYHAYGFFDCDFSAVVEFVFYVEDYFAFSEGSAEQVAVADG